jgi:hypothetical protein
LRRRREFGHDLLQSRRLAAKVLDLVRGRGPRRVASQPLLACFQELLRPTVIQVPDDSLEAAELSDALLAAQPFEDDADLFFGRELPACRPRISFTTFSTGSFSGLDFFFIFAP